MRNNDDRERKECPNRTYNKYYKEEFRAEQKAKVFIKYLIQSNILLVQALPVRATGAACDKFSVMMVGTWGIWSRYFEVLTTSQENHKRK